MLLISLQIMKKNILINIIIGLIFLFSSQISSAQSIEMQKAMWIVESFMPNCMWAGEDSIKEYKIGLLMPSEIMYDYLKELSKHRTIKGKRLKIIKFREASDIYYTHALYINPKLNSRIKSVSFYIKPGTLIITDQLKWASFYMINFLDLQNNRKKYEINLKRLKAAKIRVKRNIYIHGANKTELQKLFRQIKLEYSRNIDSVNFTSKELAKMMHNIKQLQRDNIRVRNKNEEQKKINDKNKEKIEAIRRSIDIRKEKLINSEAEIIKQEALIENNKKIMENKSKQIKLSKKELTERRSQIKKQDEVIERSENEIKDKDNKLQETVNMREFQARLFTISFFLMIIAGIMLTYIIIKVIAVNRINKKLQKVNKEVEQKNKKIVIKKKHNESLNHELRRFSIVAEHTANAVTIMDPTGIFTWVNKSFTKTYGYTLQFLKDQLDENLVNVSTHPEIKEILAKCIATKKTQVYEARNRTRYGKYLWVQTSLTPILDKYNNNITRLITIETDITHIKKTEKDITEQKNKALEQAHELEKSNKILKRLSLVAQKTENAIAIMNEVGDFQWINKGYTKLYGYSLKQLISEYSRNIITRNTSLKTVKLIRKSIEEKVAVKFHRIEKHADGHEIYVQTTLSPILNSRNKVSNLISVSTDISKLKKTEKFILQKNRELIKQQEEIVLQKNLIESKNQNINSSIAYAKTIQNAILPPDNLLNRVFKAAVIFKPLELVSGDFYWSSVLQSENINSSPIVFYAVVDCTGHGVPGAFMSMIGSSLLDEIVNEKKITKPSLILESINNEIQLMLRQKSAINNDSMEIVLCSVQRRYEDDKVKVMFAGAKRPLFYFTKIQNKVIRVKGSRKTIGGIKAIRNREKFIDHTIILDKGDFLYLTSNGIIDQPSETYEKYGSKRFMQLLEKASNEDVKTQVDIFDNHISEYQGFAPQYDDICFMAVEV